MNNHKIRVLFVIAHNRIKKNNKAPVYCRVTYNKCRKQFATGVFVKPEYWDNIRQKILPESTVNSLLNNSLSLINHQTNEAFLMLQILPNEFDVDDIYRKYKGEDSKEEITILGAYDLHNSKTEKLIGIDFNQLSWSRYIESRRKVGLFITKHYKRKDVRLKDLDLKFIQDLEYFFKTVIKLK